MKPTVLIAQTIAPDGAVFKLYTHDSQFYLYMNERQVMSTTQTHSELLLSDIGCAFRRRRPEKPRILIGGLGLGYTLRRALELAGPEATVVVAELLSEICDWNRRHLNGFNDDILADPRTRLRHTDVYELIHQAATKGPRYDAILLDVDDGPSSVLQAQNSRLYSLKGLQMLKAAITADGRAAIWAATAEPRLLKDLRRSNFDVEEIPCAKHAGAKRKRHRIYSADRGRGSS